MRRFVLLWFWYRLPIRRAAAVVAISRFTREEILQLSGCESGKVHVIPEAVTPDFHPCPKEFNAEKPVILQIGTSEHNKNLVRVAEALRGIPCQLHIIGRLTGTQCEVLKKNRIEYAEEWNLSDEQMVERYCQCDLVIFASTYEGFGMPIVEANATGRPVVTSNLCSMPEVADKAACLVDPLDSWSIRAGVLRIINEPQYRNQLIANGFENTKRFSADLIARKYAALYREVFSRSEHKSRVGS
jgi:glycosyltransferase involved in cell wall biosynthesis